MYLDGDQLTIAMVQWHDEEGGGIMEKIPIQYQPWASVFSQEEITKLPEHSKYNHKIEFVKGTTAPWGPLYSMNDRELKELRTYLD